ncbi:MAG: hypothetical protein AAF843_12860 [Bacteroidota bacterium]
MELQHRKLPNRLDEQYILPIFFLVANITAIIWFYIIHEYCQSDEVFKIQYRLDQFSMAHYKDGLKLQLLIFSVALLITPLYLKFRKRWLLIVITMIHSGVLYYFFSMN